MEQPLKQRLIGVTIAVALMVIFVPMLFEKSDDKGKSSLTGIPEIPSDVMEKPLELPKSPEELAPKTEDSAATKAGGGDKAKAPAADTGYKIVPFNEEPAPKPAAKPGKPDKAAAPPADEEAAESAAPTDGEAEEAEAPPAAASKPAPHKTVKPEPPKLPIVNHLTEPGKAAPAAAKAAAPAVKPAVTAAPPREPGKPEAAALKPKPTLKPVDSSVAKKPEPAKKPDEARPLIKTVKVNKPKPAPAVAPALHDIDDSEEPIPVPAPAPAKPVSKPKPPTPAPVKKPVAPKPPATAPAVPKPPAAAPAAAKPDAADAAPPPAAAPVAVKPAAKPVAAPAPKPAAKWAVQAGSFTDEAAAKGLADKLKQSKFPASVHPAQGPHGTVYRVQVGAEHERSRAEETLTHIKENTGISGVVTPRH